MEQSKIDVNYDEIKEYLKSLSFKKAMRGVREDEVFGTMQKLDEMYREKVDSVKEQHDKLSARVAELEKALDDAKKALEAEKTARLEEAKSRDQAEARFEEMKRISEDYEITAGQMARMMAGIQEMRDSLVESARQEADGIMEQVRREQSDIREQTKLAAEEATASRLNAITDLRIIKQMFDDIGKRAETALASVEKDISEMEAKNDGSQAEG